MTTISLLGLIGVLTSLHAICVANDMPSSAPAVFGLEAAAMFAAGIAVIVFALFGTPENSWIALIVAILLKCIFLLDAYRRGYKISGLIVREYKSQAELNT